MRSTTPLGHDASEINKVGGRKKFSPQCRSHGSARAFARADGLNGGATQKLLEREAARTRSHRDSSWKRDREALAPW